ncbi:MAG TPA: potassium channel protein [Enhygromyxa sp.]|nr:potassium channel protein [Enhygromyxa sp.]
MLDPPRRRGGMANLDNQRLDAQAQGLTRSAALIALVFLIGVLGYLWVGGPEHDLLDAIYMTMITLTTVGYSETIDLTNNTEGRIFTMALLVVGVGALAYFFSNLTAFLVEGNLARIFWRRRMHRMIKALDHHYVVCGAGRLGQHMIRELLATERRFVLIDHDEPRARALLTELHADFPIVIGDATDEEILREAAIERAVGLCAAISSDKDNLLIVMNARIIKPQLRIVARCTDQKYVNKLRRAGADSVVSPDVIGGLRLVSELIRPDAVTFLDTMLRDKEKRLRIEEVVLQPGSRAIHRTVGSLRRDPIDGLLIIAVRKADSDAWTFNPSDEFRLEAQHRLVVMSSPEARRAAEERWK